MTIVVQVYWNYNNYKTNKQRVTNDIQVSLDNALEEYYAHLAKTDFLTIINSDSMKPGTMFKNIRGNSSFMNSKDPKKIDITSIKIETDNTENIDSLLKQMQEDVSVKLKGTSDMLLDSLKEYHQTLPKRPGFRLNQYTESGNVQVIRGRKAFDSIKVMKSIGTILISMENDSLEYQKVDSLLEVQFEQKNISPNYILTHYKSDSLYHQSTSNLDTKELLSVDSKSTYLKPHESISLKFENPYKDALKLSLSGMILSLILSVAVISCLFYLLKIINRQKQLAEVKNDLISNITHEFNTPIATIGVALESMNSFDALENKEKTKSYLSMSSQQLSKLNVMVEKLLETASLDSENLELQKESVEMTEFLQNIVEKHQMQTELKTITYLNPQKELFATIDVFHFENAINNILDNALKYGGNEIDISIGQRSSLIFISISDSGTSLSKVHKDKIFEKFYRVPKGNTHDIKGFGIGLFYTKTIIEKHGGSVDLDLKDHKTTFKITIPNV